MSNGSITWDNDDISKTMFSLVKYNRGFWKSPKQAKFAQKRWAMTTGLRPSYLEQLGMEVHDDQFVIEVGGTFYPQNPGFHRHSGRHAYHFVHCFICDDQGVVKQIKIGYNKETVNMGGSYGRHTKLTATWDKSQIRFSRESGSKPPTKLDTAWWIVEGQAPCFTLKEAKVSTLHYTGLGEFDLLVAGDGMVKVKERPIDLADAVKQCVGDMRRAGYEQMPEIEFVAFESSGELSLKDIEQALR